ncbi:hypothetical protein [Loigolactobacillus backii]|uniref:Uncharacterized protein n=1 Tax=Loigolactobacillus backii TaxID=375175 RepID=A0A192GYC4_9LACO|nr:hypothetical protein [Loigolactobacillus backii]ANK58817.1 hypothetical protein AYR52_00195 [Loigolactobacillus backii]ANK61519.1 hypothetical protein AYR53_01315 [Loigolactobacillus backii]ANK63807.1 hypothetical protein AYR54_00190 [Loigolactobacillus backii]ANK66255.1 hypothetical protein AYR55_00190 [Loigolactobacillus backii]ANK69283.1 hypothetical protein AYR56_03400 [Loigolactobacillus backii]
MKLSEFFQTALIEGQPVMRTDYELVADRKAALHIPLTVLAQIYDNYFYTTRYVTQNFELNKMEIADIRAETGASITNESFQKDLKRIVVEVDTKPSTKQVNLMFQDTL